MPEEKESAPNTAEILLEILKWNRFENFPKLRKILLDTLRTDLEKLAYELTDGERSRRDIANMMGLPDSTIRSWWDKWYDFGILEPSGKRKGRPQKIMALEDMGIETPKLPSKKPEAKAEEAKPEAQPTSGSEAQKAGEKNT